MLDLNEDERTRHIKYLDMSKKELTKKLAEETRIKFLIKDKHEELVQFLKEKYPEEFI